MSLPSTNWSIRNRRRPAIDCLECRITPAPITIERYAVGSDAGIDAQVRVYSGTNNLLTTITPYGAGFQGGVRVGTGDFNGDGIQDIVTAAGVGGGPNVKIFDGSSFAEINSFFAYAPGFGGGVYLSIADVNADGIADIATAAGPGGGPHVQVIDGSRLGFRSGGTIDEAAKLASFYAFSPSFRGGATIAAADFNADGFADLALAAGSGGGPHIRIVDATLLRSLNADATIRDDAGLIGGPRLPETGESLSSFYAFGNPSFGGGVVLAAGDVDFDGVVDLSYGAATQGSQVAIRRGRDASLFQSFQAFEASYTGGVRLASVDSDTNGSAESLVIGRATGSSQVRVVRGFAPFLATFDTQVFPGFTGGVFVG